MTITVLGDERFSEAILSRLGWLFKCNRYQSCGVPVWPRGVEDFWLRPWTRELVAWSGGD